MKSGEIRQKWLDFFETKGHKIEESASLVPHNDPSLLWINAGMAPLKRYFDGTVKPDNPRIANAQKCIRTNDIENVGKTKRHHTLFEMLGNFSIGDYFKEETITWAWEFLTDKKWIGFDPDRLSVTVYHEDDEAYKIWKEKIGIPEERIYKLDEDNFWDIGEGPCGPCTEIFYDRGDAYGDLSDPEVNPAGENERFLEVWNLVFSQFNHNKDGSYAPLPNKNIDTGAGLERFTTILQDVDSTFDTDLFLPTIEETCSIANVKYKENTEIDVALKVIADHIRTVAFAIGDGVLPSNEGRGYVIRRLLRRAVRYGKVLGVNEPFLYRLVPIVASVMGGYYKEIVEKQQFIEKIIRVEEERFHETLSDGLNILAEMIQEANKQGKSEITGDQSFKLYDTYGFPLDLTEDFAQENGFTVDHDGFEKAMQEQRERARAARQEVDSMKVQGGPLTDLEVKSEYVGYNNLEVRAKVEAIIFNDQLVDIVSESNTCLVVLDQTPFYAESGGQVSDHGKLENTSFKGNVQDVFKAPNGQHVHTLKIESGTIKVGDEVSASVAKEMREDIVKNHTATHLLHKALKEVLGDHVNQAGSLVAPERLRFDFSHFGSISEEELTQIEQKVNAQIWKNTALKIEQKSLNEAKAMGAMALFGEKYGDTVRVVQVGDYSIELCGGCHVNQTSQIGLFKILSENGIGSGIRRIEAVTGKHAYQFLSNQLELLDQGSQLLKTKIDEVPKRIEMLLSQNKELVRENESLRGKLNTIEAGSLSDQVKQVGNVPVLVAQLKQVNADTMRSMIDELKEKLKSVVIVFGTVNEGKVQLASAVTSDLVKQGYHAGKIIKEVAAICGGGGGGRPDMAQAGGKDPSKLQQALDSVETFIKQNQEK
ncbi:alanine--tRNA ligase [Chengkuizengella sediminis]|uniref:alanine--tRNA ligase n=1 Tax=Chengkuizengella sediminis TaxID=1885917 RepID=UPI0013898417|nr:alanine--tRNA ligase [Chengkuizengella sediminis]NDI33963.1 alanine--tRNA ligase [Chengkuizengella sediminis]